MVSAVSAIEPQDSTWRHEAPWLTRLWRLSPLTLLVHNGVGRAGRLIGEGILPLTARRDIDLALAAGEPALRPPVASPAAAPRRVPERVLRFDAAGTGDPDTRLREALFALLPLAARDGRQAAARLADAVGEVHAAGGARLLLVVENLDQLLLPRNDSPAGCQALCDGLVDLLQDGSLPVHVLLVVDERADALLDRLRRHLPHIDDHRLRLGASRDAVQATTRPLSAPLPAADFRRTLDAMLLRVALAVEPPLPTPAAVASAAPLASIIEVLAEPAPEIGPAPAMRRRRWRLPVVALASMTAGLTAVWWWPAATPAPPAAAVATAPLPPPSPSPAPARPPLLPALELAQALQPAGLPLVQVADDADWAGLLRGLDQRPGLALVRYDALQAAAATGPARPRLQVLAPLFTETLYFAVRSDAAPKALHELRNARINVGPAGGARALTVGGVWSALFGSSLPAAQADRRPVAQALQGLRDGKVDVVAWAGPAGMAPGAGLRLLPADRSDPSWQRLQRRFLPTTVAVGGAARPGLAVMNFLVAGAASSPGDLQVAVRALCQALPTLRQTGQPLWRSVRADQVLPVAWPYAEAAAEIGRCEARPSVTPPTRSPP